MRDERAPTSQAEVYSLGRAVARRAATFAEASGVATHRGWRSHKLNNTLSDSCSCPELQGTGLRASWSSTKRRNVVRGTGQAGTVTSDEPTSHRTTNGVGAIFRRFSHHRLELSVCWSPWGTADGVSGDLPIWWGITYPHSNRHREHDACSAAALRPPAGQSAILRGVRRCGHRVRGAVAGCAWRKGCTARLTGIRGPKTANHGGAVRRSSGGLSTCVRTHSCLRRP
jgi:hypothetical protein